MNSGEAEKCQPPESANEHSAGRIAFCTRQKAGSAWDPQHRFKATKIRIALVNGLQGGRHLRDMLVFVSGGSFSSWMGVSFFNGLPKRMVFLWGFLWTPSFFSSGVPFGHQKGAPSLKEDTHMTWSPALIFSGFPRAPGVPSVEGAPRIWGDCLVTFGAAGFAFEEIPETHPKR